MLWVCPVIFLLLPSGPDTIAFLKKKYVVNFLSSQSTHEELTASHIKHCCLSPSDFFAVLPKDFPEHLRSFLSPGAQQFTEDFMSFK